MKAPLQYAICAPPFYKTLVTCFIWRIFPSTIQMKFSSLSATNSYRAWRCSCRTTGILISPYFELTKMKNHRQPRRQNSFRQRNMQLQTSSALYSCLSFNYNNFRTVALSYWWIHYSRQKHYRRSSRLSFEQRSRVSGLILLMDTFIHVKALSPQAQLGASVPRRSSKAGRRKSGPVLSRAAPARARPSADLLILCRRPEPPGCADWGDVRPRQIGVTIGCLRLSRCDPAALSDRAGRRCRRRLRRWVRQGAVRWCCGSFGDPRRRSSWATAAAADADTSPPPVTAYRAYPSWHTASPPPMSLHAHAFAMPVLSATALAIRWASVPS